MLVGIDRDSKQTDYAVVRMMHSNSWSWDKSERASTVYGFVYSKALALTGAMVTIKIWISNCFSIIIHSEEHNKMYGKELSSPRRAIRAISSTPWKMRHSDEAPCPRTDTWKAMRMILISEDMNFLFISWKHLYETLNTAKVLFGWSHDENWDFLVGVSERGGVLPETLLTRQGFMTLHTWDPLNIQYGPVWNWYNLWSFDF